MKICIAQTKSLKGSVQENIQNHLWIIEDAIEQETDLIIFPELSISSYEPELAAALATSIEAEIFNPFQLLSDAHQITIGVGMPTKTVDGINISLLIFQPNHERLVYAKQMLHIDEVPYFVCGNKSVLIDIKGKKIAFGICYESLQREHFFKAHQKGADIYIASVAKPKGGIEKAYAYFPKLAAEFYTPILLSNSVGFCDNFQSVGQSAVWNKKGSLVGQLDTENQGFLIYDTELETVNIHQLIIEQGQLSDLESVFQIYLDGKAKLEKNGIFQWTDNYPTISIIESDLKKGILYLLKNGTEILGAINISEEQESVYSSVDWAFDDTKILVIHRLVVEPKYQGKGYGKKLMDFAEAFALENHYGSIRLDAYSQNEKVIEFYKEGHYVIRGNVHFPKRVYPFYCMEKKVER